MAVQVPVPGAVNLHLDDGETVGVLPEDSAEVRGG
jgi:hypothetical protein